MPVVGMKQLLNQNFSGFKELSAETHTIEAASPIVMKKSTINPTGNKNQGSLRGKKKI